MDRTTHIVVVLAFLGVLAITSVYASINILRKGWIYHRLDPASRPRRWILAALMVLFAAFLVWFPVWLVWPDAMISKFLTALFGMIWLVVGLTLRWFTGFVDHWIVRRGWPLR